MQPRSGIFFVAAVLIAGLAAGIFTWQPWRDSEHQLTIALVAPSNPKADPGDNQEADPGDIQESRSMINGVALAVDQYNRSREAQQPKVGLELYFESDYQPNDDSASMQSLPAVTTPAVGANEESCNKRDFSDWMGQRKVRAADGAEMLVAAQVVNEIPQHNTIVVLGHRKSPTSLNAAKIYHCRIQMIGATAASPSVTENNAWSDSVIANNSAVGEQLARYLNKLDATNVLVLYSQDLGSDDFSSSMMYALYNHKPDDVKLTVKQPGWLQTRPALGDFDAVVLALRDDESVEAIKYVRDSAADGPGARKDIKLLGSTSIGKQSFPSDQFGPAKRDFYTDDLIAPTSILFDSAGEKAQAFRSAYVARYGDSPDSAAAAYFDAANLVLTVLKRADVEEMPSGMSTSRWFWNQYQIYKARNKAREIPHSGITGLIRFTDHGIDKELFFGQFSQGHFITAPDQLGPDVIYTGYGNVQITEFDEQTMGFRASFDLWMRSRSELPGPEDLTFSNLFNDLEPAEFGKCSGPPVNVDKPPKFHYLRCPVNGVFQATYDPTRASFGEFDLYIRLRHRDRQKQELLFVSDLLADQSTEDADSGRFHLNDIGPVTVRWRSMIFTPFQSSLFEDDLGLLAETAGRDAQLEFSSFNYHIRIKENTLWIRGSLPRAWQYGLLVSGLMVLTGLVLYWNLLSGRQRFATFAIFVPALILALEPLSYQYVDFIRFAILKNVFDSLWVAYLAAVIGLALNVFVWDRLESRTERPVPRLMRTLTNVACFLGGLFLFIAWVLEQNPTSLLATSGVAAMLLGLALQPNMIDFFAGIALNMEKNISIGTRVRVDDRVDGTVLEINWRTTTIQADDQSLHAVPNSVLARQTVVIREAEAGAEDNIRGVTASGSNKVGAG